MGSSVYSCYATSLQGTLLLPAEISTPSAAHENRCTQPAAENQGGERFQSERQPRKLHVTSFCKGPAQYFGKTDVGKRLGCTSRNLRRSI